jgi:hypothetical protein
MTKKITLATVKSFIRKTPDLHIMVKGRFDGMVDCVMPVSDQFEKAERTERCMVYTHGVEGAWFVGQSRDRFSPYEDERMVGISVYNCCGSFILATPKK